MNMFGRSWRLFRASWAVLQANKSLTAFPAASAVITAGVSFVYFIIVVALVFIIPGLSESIFSESGGDEGNLVATVFGFVTLFVYYLLVSIVSTYLGVALAAAAEQAIDGGKPTVSDGLAVARQRLGPIVQFSALNAIVGVIVSALRGGNDDGPNIIGMILSSVIDMAWGVVTFLVVPVIAIKGVGAIDAIKESGSLLRKTFGEQLVGTGGMGLIMFLISLVVGAAGVGLTILLGELVGGFGYVLGIALLFIGVAIVAVIGSTLTTIYKVAVYRYAETGSVPDEFEIDLIRGAFKQKNKRGSI